MKEKCEKCGKQFDEVDYMHYLYSLKKKFILSDFKSEEIIYRKLCPICSGSKMNEKKYLTKENISTN